MGCVNPTKTHKRSMTLPKEQPTPEGLPLARTVFPPGPVERAVPRRDPHPEAVEPTANEQKDERTVITKKSDDDTLNNLLLKKSFGDKPATQLFLFDPKCAHNNQRTLYMSHASQLNSPCSTQKEWDKVIRRQGEKDNETFMLEILQLSNRNWYRELIEGTGERGRHFVNYANTKSSQQLQEHFNWLSWALAKYLFQSASLFVPVSGDKKLPPRDGKEWRDGFKWKGVYVRMMPYSDAYYVKSEMQAQRNLVLELAELANYESDLEGTAGMFLRNCLLPMMAMARFGADVVLAAPCVCLPADFDQDCELASDDADESEPVPANSSPAKQNLSKIHNMSSHFLNLHQSNDSFSYWGGDATFIQDSPMKSMPMLSRLTSANVVPVIDPESVANPEAVPKYLLVNTTDMVPPQTQQDYFLRVPWDTSFYIEVFTKVDQTRFTASALSSMMGYDDNKLTEETVTSRSQVRYVPLYGWDLQIRSLAQSEPLDNRRLNAIAAVGLEEDSTPIQGNGLVACHYFKGESKVAYAAQRGTEQEGDSPAERVKKGIDAVVGELSSTVVYSNVGAIKELLHRKALGVRHEWLVLSLIPNKGKATVLLCVDLLTRAIRKVVETRVHSIGSEAGYKALLCEYLSSALKQKGKRGDEIADELFRALFLSRLRVLKEAESIITSETIRSFFQGKDIMQLVCQSARYNPVCFLEAAESCFGISFEAELMQKARADKFAVLKSKPPVAVQNIDSLGVRVVSAVSSKEFSYLVLVRMIFENEVEEKRRVSTNPETLKKLYRKNSRTSFRRAVVDPPQATEGEEPVPTQSEGVRDTISNVYKSFVRGGQGASAENYRSTRDMLPHKVISSSAAKPPLGRNAHSEYKKANNVEEDIKCEKGESVRLKNMHMRHMAVTQILIGDTADTGQPTPPPIYELTLPAALYQTDSFLLKSGYDFPKHDIVQDWAHFNELMFGDLPTSDGSHRLMAESQLFLLISAFFKERDLDQSAKVASQLWAYLSGTTKWPQETVLSALTMLGILAETGKGLAEARSFYLAATLLYLRLYGDPRGRGNGAVAWGLMLAQKLKKLAELDNKQPMDREYAEELDEAMRYAIGCVAGSEECEDAVSTSEVYLTIKERVLSEPAEDLEEDVEKGHRLMKILSAPIKSESPYSPELFGWVLQHLPLKYPQWSPRASWRVREILDSVQSSFSTGSFVLSSGSPMKDHKQVAQSIWDLFSEDPYSLCKPSMKGVLYAWGANRYGQLGANEDNVDTEDMRRQYPHLCVSMKNKVIVSIACSHSSSFALDMNGTVFAWGNNEFGQLGLGSNLPKHVQMPSVVRGLPETIKQVACGNEHTVALTLSNELYTWGHGDSGLLGHGNNESLCVPKRLEELKKRVLIVACGGLHTVVVTKDNEVFAWGRGEGGQLGAPEKVLEQFVTDNKDCFCNKPRLVDSECLRGKSFVGIACGEAHTLVLTKEGEVFGWGFSNYGQLGLGYTCDTFEPGTGNYNSKVCEATKLEALAGVAVRQIVAGSTFTLFLTDKGELYGCGMNDLGQVGVETVYRDLPTCIQSLHIFIAYVGTNNVTATTDVPSPIPILCFSGIQVTQVSAGENHAVATTESPSVVWAWGDHRCGQLGIGELAKVTSPRPIQALSGAVVAQVACGGSHTMAVIGAAKDVEGKRRKREKPTNVWDMRANSTFSLSQQQCKS